MKFTPMSDEELKKQFPVLVAGESDFTVIDAVEKESKSGNPMIRLRLKVWDKEGQQGYLSDYLVASEKMHWKIKHFMEAINKVDLYDSGIIRANELVNCSGKMITHIKNNPQFGDQLSVKDYLKTESSGAKKVDPVKTNEVPNYEDDIPF